MIEPVDLAFTHLDSSGRAVMVDVGDKTHTDRRATAVAQVELSPKVAVALVEGGLPKGDAIAVCRIAGIQAAKRTSELVPLTHPVPVSHVSVDVSVDAETGLVTITTSARTVAGTGVEIEALIAATIAGVTLYDMVKSVDRGAVIREARVTSKRGGRSGDVTYEGDR